MRISKLELNKIKEVLIKLPRFLTKYAFLTFLGLFIIALLIGSFVFWKYNILVKKTVFQSTEKPLQFEEKTYQEVSKIWQERERKFKEANLKEYSSFRIFQIPK